MAIAIRARALSAPRRRPARAAARARTRYWALARCVARHAPLVLAGRSDGRPQTNAQRHSKVNKLEGLRALHADSSKSCWRGCRGCLGAWTCRSLWRLWRGRPSPWRWRGRTRLRMSRRRSRTRRGSRRTSRWDDGIRGAFWPPASEESNRGRGGRRAAVVVHAIRHPR